MRSEPGLGRLVTIYTLGPPIYVGDSDGPVWYLGIGEDYADSVGHIHVKVAAGVPPSEIVRELRNLADAVEDGNFHKAIDPDKDCLWPCGGTAPDLGSDGMLPY